MKKLFDLSISMKVFTLAQQIIIASLIEEIEWLKERVARLELSKGEEMLTGALDPYRQEEEG